MIQHLLHHFCVTTNRNTLVIIVEVIIIINQTYWKTLYNKSRQFSTWSTPLLFSIPFDQLLIDISTNQRNSLFFQIIRFFTCHFLTLLIDFSHSFLWRSNTPHFAKCIHIKWQVVHMAFVISNRTISITIKISKLLHIVPNFLIRSVENMSAIYMNLNTIYFFSIDVTCNMISFFNYC